MERSSDAALVAPCVAFVTLGCAKNEADTARMRVRLAEAGFLIEDDPAEADAVVVNTCSFIQSATEESIEAVFDAAGMPNVAAGAPLIVAGCMPARYGEDLADELVEARAFVPCSREDDIAAIVADALGVDAPGGGAAASVTLSASGGAAEVEGSRAALAALPAAPFAYVKISDGCDRFCTYCTIPYIRGRYRSFPLDDVRADVAAQVAAGAREIVLIAQDTGRWGADFDEPSSLAALVAALAEEFPQTWFRIMYIQPEGLSDELLDAVAAHDNVCDYFDIPLQHVDAGILRAMNRTGSREEFLALVDRVLAHVPGATLRTTLIAGFPGETEEEARETLRFIERIGFSRIHVFPYSQRAGTVAARLPGQVPVDVKRRRTAELIELGGRLSAAYQRAALGSVREVLLEEEVAPGLCEGYTREYLRVRAQGVPGEIVNLRLTDISEDSMLGVRE